MLNNTDGLSVFTAFSRNGAEGKTVPIPHSIHAIWEHISQTLFPHDHKNVLGMRFFAETERLSPAPSLGVGPYLQKPKSSPY